MLFVAAHTHLAAKCPLEPPEGKTMIKKLFSDDNVRKSSLKIVGAYASCPKDKSTEHKGFFIIDADSAPAVTKFFGPMTVGVRPVVPFSGVTKPCSAVQRSLLTYPFLSRKGVYSRMTRSGSERPTEGSGLTEKTLDFDRRARAEIY